MNKLKQLFGDCRIVAMPGIKSSGKTNNIVYLVSQLPKRLRQKVYFFGMPKSVASYLKSLGCHEFDNLNQLTDKTGSLIIADEVQKLKLNDRRNKHKTAKVVDFMYHNKNYLLLSSPNIREFNTIIGGFVERWALKTIKIDQCINGSQLKKVVDDYSGSYKMIDDIIVPKNEILVINDTEKIVIECDYVEMADSKANDGIEDFF